MVGVLFMWWSGGKVMMVIDEIIGWYCKWIIINESFYEIL